MKMVKMKMRMMKMKILKILKKIMNNHVNYYNM